MIKPSVTHNITEEQLINEMRKGYTSVIIVEKKCVEIDKQ